MAIQIGAAPSPTFAEPLALLSDCHKRVKRILVLLLQVGESAAGGPLADREREAFATALRCFREAAPKHTADEEVSLFPRMRASGSPAARAVLARLDALESDHQTAGLHHRAVERLGKRWLTHGVPPSTDTASSTASLRTLRDLYERHIAVEDHQVFPLVARLLDGDGLRGVGREIACRRGLDPVVTVRPLSSRDLPSAGHATS